VGERLYTIRGKSLTAAQVGDLDNPTDDERRQFAQQAGMSDKDVRLIEAICDAIVPIVLGCIGKRVEELEAKTAEIEKGGLRYVGTYQRALNYRRGDFLTHRGSLFATLRDTSPGEEPEKSDAFQLAAKRGDDAR
jgi:hypothetical protein